MYFIGADLKSKYQCASAWTDDIMACGATLVIMSAKVTNPTIYTWF